MFEIDTDKTIHLTRGDIATIEVSATDKDTDSPYTFNEGDVVRLTVCEKGGYENVVLRKDVTVGEVTKTVDIDLNSEDTKIGEIINKPTKYWYEVELNPDTAPQTIVGHDEDGAKLFILYPEGGDANER